MTIAVRSAGKRWPAWLAGGLLLVLVVPLLFVAWLLATESGLHFAARMASRLTNGEIAISESSGRLIGPLAIGEVVVNTHDLNLRVHGFTLEWDVAALLDRRLDITVLSAEQIRFSSRPEAQPEPLLAPDSLELPLAVSIAALKTGRFELALWQGEADAPNVFEASGISLALRSDGRRHFVDAAEAVLPFGRGHLSGEIDGAASPFALAAKGGLAGEEGGHAFELKFRAEGDLLAPRLRVDATGAGLSGDADIVVAPFEPVPLRSARVSLGEIDPAAFAPDAPKAALRVTADLVSAEGEDWRLSGPIQILNRLPETVDRKGLPFRQLDARLQWTPAEILIEDLVLHLPAGRIAGDLSWRPDSAGEKLGRLSAMLTLEGVEVQRLDARLPRAVLAGRVDAAGDESLQTGKLDLTVGKARLKAEGRFAIPSESGVAPNFSASGKLSAFNPRALLATAPEAQLNLQFEAEGALSESVGIEATVRLAPSTLDGRALSGRLKVRLEGERLADGLADIDFAGNRIRMSGAWGGTGDVLAINVDAPALAAIGHGLGGRANLSGTVSGTFERPSGAFELFAESLTLPGDVRVRGVNAEGRLNGGLEGPMHLALGVTGLGPLVGDPWLDTVTVVIGGRRSAHTIDLAATAAEADTLSVRMEGALVDVVAAPVAKARGKAQTQDADEPAFRWDGFLTSLETAGRFAAKLTAPASLGIGAERVVLGLAVLDAGQQGRIRLEETSWKRERIVARGGLSGLSFGLVASQDGSPPRRGAGPLVLGAEWNLQLAKTADGSVRVFRESGDLTVEGEIPARLGLERLEAVLTARENRLALSLDARGTELGALSGSVTAAAERTPEGMWQLASQQALLGSAKLAMPSIAWAGRLMRDNVVTGGSLDADFSFSGTPAEPVATGRIMGRSLSVSLVDQGLHLSGGDLLAEFDRDRLRLTRLEFVSPNRVKPRDGRVPVDRLTREPGRLKASGQIALESGVGAFRFEAERLPILQRVDRWLILSGKGTADSTWTSLDLNADFRADAGFVELADTPPPSLSDDVVILGREAPLPGGGFKLTADVSVSLGEHLYLSALGVDTRLAGDLRLRLRDGQPLSAVGSIATAGGNYKGYGQSLSIERGVINFQGALDSPGLNVVALRKGLAVEAGISVTGSARRPIIRLVSEPNVPDPEKLSWIALGHAPSGGAGADLGLLLPAAQALLGGPGGGMSEQLSRSLGFDEFSIGQGELGGATRSATSRVVGDGTAVTGEGSVSGQVLTLGKRLSRDLFVSFEQSLGGAESLVKLTYQLTRRLSLVARSGTNNSADIYYTISFE